jgi:hypothetical protein
MTAGYRGDANGFGETMRMRFLKTDGQFNAVHADMGQRFEAMDKRLDALDAKLDTLIAQFRGDKEPTALTPWRPTRAIAQL